MKKMTCWICCIFYMAIAFPVVAGEKMGEPIKPVLLIIDIQNEYMPMMEENEKEMALKYINGAIWLFREYGFPIIRVYHTDPKWGPSPDSESFQFPESVMIQDDDPKIVKNFPNAFKKTELDEMLGDMKSNTLFLCGLSAVGCVLATYHGAMDRDYNAFMFKDALISHNSRYTDFVEEVFETVSWKAVEVMLESAKYNQSD